MADNRSLQEAHRAKQDEFYTQLTDIENELRHYKDQLRGKVVFCNCDDPYESNFFKYFAMNFNVLGLKKLMATCYDRSPIAYTQLSLFGDDKTFANKYRRAYKIEITEVEDYNGDGAVDLSDVEYLIKNKKNALTLLKGDGDFRSDECIELLKTADVVVTNPPFSLFREYVAQLVKYEKKFLIIGNQNAVTYKEIFPLIKDEKIWLGYKSGAQEFDVPPTFEKNNVYVNANGKRMAKFGNICWYTNLDTTKRHENLPLYKKYTPEEYPKYDNYDAIEVSKVADIPYDYLPSDGVSGDMGVPITFLDKYNPEQFEIVKFRKGDDNKDLTYTSTESVGGGEGHAVFQDYRTEESVTELWESPLHSSTNTIRPSSRLSVQPRAKERDSRADFGTNRAESRRLLSMANASSNEFLSDGKCNGLMGVPITFLDRYNPEQFEIIGLDRYTVPKEFLVGGRVAIGGKPRYARIIIRRKKIED